MKFSLRKRCKRHRSLERSGRCREWDAGMGRENSRVSGPVAVAWQVRGSPGGANARDEGALPRGDAARGDMPNNSHWVRAELVERHRLRRAVQASRPHRADGAISAESLRARETISLVAQAYQKHRREGAAAAAGAALRRRPVSRAQLPRSRQVRDIVLLFAELLIRASNTAMKKITIIICRRHDVVVPSRRRCRVSRFSPVAHSLTHPLARCLCPSADGLLTYSLERVVTTWHGQTCLAQFLTVWISNWSLVLHFLSSNWE